MTLKYRIVEMRSIIHLQLEVSDQIKAGWEPLGGPFPMPWKTSHNVSGTGYGQAMIKRTSNDQ